ncbi:unnamed protein product [Schistosoma curassoni]|uniref:Ion transport domain-containing protein n=1 Tax=Schistosoma curassoni TaxID=6186 RepID=A0A183K3S8_9TREM|nr:unnamed protein product [Schistosoma curassoni]
MKHKRRQISTESNQCQSDVTNGLLLPVNEIIEIPIETILTPTPPPTPPPPPPITTTTTPTVTINTIQSCTEKYKLLFSRILDCKLFHMIIVGLCALDGILVICMLLLEIESLKLKMFFNCKYAALALPIRAFTSARDPQFSLMVLPYYVEVFASCKCSPSSVIRLLHVVLYQRILHFPLRMLRLTVAETDVTLPCPLRYRLNFTSFIFECISYTIILLFLIEIPIKLWTFGYQFYQYQWIELLDVFVCIISFTVDTYNIHRHIIETKLNKMNNTMNEYTIDDNLEQTLPTTIADAAGLLVLFRLWRVIRIVNCKFVCLLLFCFFVSLFVYY